MKKHTKQKSKTANFHPMLFSTSMVLAIDKDLKKETRRIMKPQPIDNRDVDGNFFDGNLKDFVKVDFNPAWKAQFIEKFSKYKVGDTLWVRETFMESPNFPILPKKYYYKASVSDQFLDEWKGCWKPSIFMTKAACRIFLEITDIRFERLNKISKKDTISEGIEPLLMSRMQLIQSGQLYRDYSCKPSFFNEGLNAINSYKSLWNKINGPESWSYNPWVWIFSFKKVDGKSFK